MTSSRRSTSCNFTCAAERLIVPASAYKAYAENTGFNDAFATIGFLTTGATSGDIDGDGNLNVADITKLVEMILGK